MGPKINRKRPRIGVHFSRKQNHVITLPSTSEADMASTWYDTKEFEDFRREAPSSSASVIQLLIKENKLESDCVPYYEKEIQQQRRKRKKCCIMAVLEAQRRLKGADNDKVETLAAVSSQFSNWSRVIAQRVAQLDAPISYETNVEFQSCKRQCRR